MKEIARFLGMGVFLCNDLESTPHFHVAYNHHNAVIDADKFAIFSGTLPPRVASLAVEWAILNQALIKENWEIHKSGGTGLKMIPPLVE